MQSRNVSPLIEVTELSDILHHAGVKVVDASWYLPSDQRYPIAEYEVAHIPGAVFFNIDEVCDSHSPFPHMLPTIEHFEAAMSQLGISHDDTIVVYDGSGVFSAPRLWWTLRVFGHDNVQVLNGGLPAWRAHGGSVASLFNDSPVVTPTEYKAHFRPELVCSAERVMENLDAQTFQLVDARANARFSGEQPEPRPGVRSGHIPGAYNVPFKLLLDAKGRMMKPKTLKQRFEAAGVDLDKPIVTSCGSGITASVLALALYCIEKHDVPVYDGSWAEWGSCAQYPVNTL